MLMMMVSGSLCFKAPVEHGFGRFIQGSGGFVKQDNFGLREQGADEGDALQFSGREFVLPVIGFI